LEREYMTNILVFEEKLKGLEDLEKLKSAKEK